MALLGRALLYITRLVFNFLVWLFLQLIRLLLPVVLTVLRWQFRLMTTAFVATATGPKVYIERLASEWTRRLITFGISPDNIDTAHSVCRIFATSTIVLGWIFAVLFTVLIFRVVFGYFT